MILGIDVGGTHTDAVLLDKNGLLGSAKVVTDHQDLLTSVRAALKEIAKQSGNLKLKRFNLSTTLCTNAIVQEELEDVGVLVTAGPGIDPGLHCIGNHYAVVPGSLDHRGKEIRTLDTQKAKELIEGFRQKGVDVFAVIGKFSPRNPVHEDQIASLIGRECRFLTTGHSLSGQLNFPRRIATSYYNSAVWPIFNEFASSVSTSISEMGMSPQLNILKADGGTMPFAQARLTPVESIFSGPAASIMGITALCDITEDALLLDVGGTTTDVAVFADGDPLIEAESVELRHRPTLVRAMKTKSIGLGGDSAVKVIGEELQIGPKRLGACLAMGGSEPTLVDALNCVKSFCYGDVQASNKGMSELGTQLACSPEDAAWSIIRAACAKIRQETMDMVHAINERPVYTVHEFLEYRKIKPKKLYLMGGPAKVMAPFLSREFGLPALVPDNYEVANALGAALARPTMQAELFADTERKTLTIPVLQINQAISGKYSLEQAKKDAAHYLCSYIGDTFAWYVTPSEVETVEESAMNMVKDVYTVGQDIRVKCQIKPGIDHEYERSVRCVCKEQ